LDVKFAAKLKKELGGEFAQEFLEEGEHQEPDTDAADLNTPDLNTPSVTISDCNSESQTSSKSSSKSSRGEKSSRSGRDIALNSTVSGKDAGENGSSTVRRRALRARRLLRGTTNGEESGKDIAGKDAGATLSLVNRDRSKGKVPKL